jgi:hypothetical protein
VEDMMVAKALFEKALSSGAGTKLPL